MAKRSKPASDALGILHRRFYEGKTSRLKNLEEARANEEIAGKIHALRTAAVICRLEDADYEGHSLALRRRIGAALNQRVEIRFVPIRRPA